MSNMTIKTATARGMDVILTAKKGRVWAVVSNDKIKIDAEIMNGHGGRGIGWAGKTAGVVDGKLQAILLTIPKSDFDKITEFLKADKKAAIAATETKISVSWGCDAADTCYVTGAGSMLIDQDIELFFNRAACESTTTPDGCEAHDATMMTYGGWSATGDTADRLIAGFLANAAEKKAKKEKEDAGHDKYQSRLCPECGTMCLGSCDADN